MSDFDCSLKDLKLENVNQEGEEISPDAVINDDNVNDDTNVDVECDVEEKVDEVEDEEEEEEEEDSDDVRSEKDREVKAVVKAVVEAAMEEGQDPEAEVEPQSSTLKLLEESELSMMGVASKELLLDHLESLPSPEADPELRQHICVPQHRPSPPPQSPRLALLELGAAPPSAATPPDRRLANWERWMRVRAAQLRPPGRSHASRAENSGESRRWLNERKTVLEHVAIEAPPDRFRGGPQFWRMPERLADRGDCGQNFYEMQKTLPEKGIIPDIEYVGVPDCIKKEKHVEGAFDRRSPRDVWNSNPYLKQQKEVMKEKLHLVEHHEPIMNDLVIIGNYYQKFKQETVPDIPVLTVSQEPEEIKEREFENEMTPSLMTLYQEERENKVKVSRIADHVACLKIGNEEFFYEEPPKSKKIGDKLTREKLLGLIDGVKRGEFRLTFKSPLGESRTKLLRLENRGVAKIVYWWRRCPDQRLSLPEDLLSNHSAYGHHFFFNKNRDLILPGQILEFRFTFRSRFPGIFQESWTLMTKPTLYAEDEMIVVNLWGMTPPNDAVRGELRSLQEHVDARCGAAVAGDVIHRALDRARRRVYPEPPYAYNFLREERFLHVNPDFGYHEELVDALCELYSSSCLKDDSENQPWDLNILTLRERIIQNTTDKARDETLEKLSDICLQLRSRVYVSRAGRSNKYSCVYNLLCRMAALIEQEAQNLRVVYGLRDDAETSATGTDAGPAIMSSTDHPSSAHGIGKRRSKLTSKTSPMRRVSSSSKSGTPSSVGREVAVKHVSPSRRRLGTGVTHTRPAAPSKSPSTMSASSDHSAGGRHPDGTSAELLGSGESLTPLPELPLIIPARGDLPETEVDEKLVRRVYRQALFVVVNQILTQTVEHVAAALESYRNLDTSVKIPKLSQNDIEPSQDELDSCPSSPPKESGSIGSDKNQSHESVNVKPPEDEREPSQGEIGTKEPPLSKPKISTSRSKQSLSQPNVDVKPPEEDRVPSQGEIETKEPPLSKQKLSTTRNKKSSSRQSVDNVVNEQRQPDI